MNFYHLKTDDDRVYTRVPRSKYTLAFRTEISAMASALGWSESKCVNYIHRKLEDKKQVKVEVTQAFQFNNRLIYQ